jgi:filamentous hemagglutinin
MKPLQRRFGLVARNGAEEVPEVQEEPEKMRAP